MPYTYKDHVHVRLIADTPGGDDMVARQNEDLVIEEATEEQQLEALDNVAQRLLKMSGEEFLQRWNAGEFLNMPDTARARKVAHVSLLLPDGSFNN